MATVNIKDLKVLQQSDNNTINIVLEYNVKNTNINDTVEIDFS